MIRLVPASAARPQLPTPPLASLALLLLTSVIIAGLFAAPRGPGLRFATAVEIGDVSEAAMVRVTVLRGGVFAVDGTVVERAALGAAVQKRLAERTGAGTALVVSPDASYGDMISAYGAIASIPDGPVVAIPTRAWVQAKEAP